MRIIKPGDKDASKERAFPFNTTLRCEHCGCEFRVDRGDDYTVTYDQRDPVPFVTARCPMAFCGATVVAALIETGESPVDRRG